MASSSSRGQTPRRRRNPTPKLNPGIEPARFDAWRSFIQSHGVVIWLMSREMTAATHRPLVWFEVLLYLNDAEDGLLTMQQLEDGVTLSQSGLSQLLTRMQRARLIQRVRDRRDARRQLVRITDAGVEQLRAMARIHRTSIQRHFADLMSAEEAAVVTTVFQRILEAGRQARGQLRRGED
jgi:DNA-binding MarR family transcriptional regulator